MLPDDWRVEVLKGDVQDSTQGLEVSLPFAYGVVRALPVHIVAMWGERERCSMTNNAMAIDVTAPSLHQINSEQTASVLVLSSFASKSNAQ